MMKIITALVLLLALSGCEHIVQWVWTQKGPGQWVATPSYSYGFGPAQVQTQ